MLGDFDNDGIPDMQERDIDYEIISEMGPDGNQKTLIERDAELLIPIIRMIKEDFDGPRDWKLARIILGIILSIIFFAYVFGWLFGT